MKRAWLALIAISMGISSAGWSYDCNSDCGAEARFTYPCPTIRKPHRRCDGKNPAKFAACEADKEVSCRLRDEIYHAYADEVRRGLQGAFNAHTWQAAVDNGEQSKYMTECVSAGLAVCAGIGAKVGGPWGAALSGAVGLFVSDRLCEQSQSW